MVRKMRAAIFCVIATGSVLGTIGCQTYQNGQVLPSPYYLRDDLHYFPKGPQFPLANELSAMRAAEEEAANAER